MGRSYATTSGQKPDGQRRDPRGVVIGEKKEYDFTMRPTSLGILNNTTRYPSMIGKYPWPPLKSGYNNTKIGKRITKGRWAGMPIYTLTLTERATCGPCAHKHTCYGNAMRFAARQQHGERLEADLDEQLSGLQSDHPDGFVVRLHVLGDFYSIDYVKRWATWLRRFPALRIYGYTARTSADPIGAAISKYLTIDWDRVAIRLSDGDIGHDDTLSIRHAYECPPSAFVCPAQTEKTACCATCGACWDSHKTVAFISH